MMSSAKIFHLVYRSHAASDFQDGSISEILEVARKHNSQANLTGLLIYRRRAFVQLLEGDEKEVRELYEKKIRNDLRHERIHTMIESFSKNRIFEHWSMAYVDDNRIQSSSEALFDLFDAIIQNNSSDRNTILPILKKFLGILPDIKTH